MTILNVWVDRHRALVGVDTLAVHTLANTGRQASKMVPLVHANSIIAVRGHLVLLPMIFERANMGELDGFDSLDAAMPELILHAKAALERFRLQAAQMGAQLSNGADFDQLQIVVAGFSESLGEMAVVVYSRDAAGELERRLISGGADWLSAWGDPGKVEPPYPNSLAALRQIARAQKRQAEVQYPGQKLVGGHLIVAEITRDAMRVCRACDLEAVQASPFEAFGVQISRSGALDPNAPIYEQWGPE